MLPREHGAYALVLAPLLTAFCRGHASWVGAGLALATLALFTAHEPALVLLSQRGGRAQREHGDRARGAFARRAWVALAAGGAAYFFADAATRRAVVAVCALGVVVGFLAVKALEKSGAGTILLAVTSSVAGLPVALANGWSSRDASLTALVFAFAGTVAMLTVRELIPNRRRERELATRLGWLGAALVAVTLVAATLRAEVPGRFAWGLLPASLVVLVLLLVRPHPRHLRRVGWTLAAAKVATFLLMALG